MTDSAFMRLADFIIANIEPILVEWEAFARSLGPGAIMDTIALRDDAEAILRATAIDMGASQSLAQQSEKSKGHGGAGGDESERLDGASTIHGVARVGSAFDLTEVVAEYRALRASVLRLWRESAPDPDLSDLDDITRFNESIDQSLAQAVGSYTRRVDQSRRMFLAILGHDLRNPLNSIMLSAQLVSISREDDPEATGAASQIANSANAISKLVNDLLDFAATGLGAAMPIHASPLDLEKLCQEVVDEFQAANRNRTLRFEPQGDLRGTWDGSRVRQVISNLVGNALQHGSASMPVGLVVRDQVSEVVIEVRNQGTPIPSAILPIIFDPLVRGQSSEAHGHRRSGSIGLGLYIAREIVIAHGGSINVQSSAATGTVFTVRLPRHVTTKRGDGKKEKT